MRLAFGMGRTVRELHESMDAEEWNQWLIFHSLYDLPDGFLVTAKICSIVSHALGGKGEPWDFAPYYKPDAKTPDKPRNDLKPAYEFIAAYAKERAEQGNPLPAASEVI